MDNLARETVLAGGELNRPHFTVKEHSGLGLIRLQTFHRTPGAVANLNSSLGVELPGPGETQADQNRQWFWSAPGEWVVAVHAGTEGEVIDMLREKLDGLFVVTSVMSDSRVVLDIAGQAARDIMARGSTVDFHPASFGAGRCLNTRLAGVPVMVACSSGGESFLLFADRSVGDYLLQWFGAASSDLGE